MCFKKTVIEEELQIQLPVISAISARKNPSEKERFLGQYFE